MKYDDIINIIEELISYTNDDYIHKKLNEIANSLDELYEDSQYKIELLSEDIDILEEKLRDCKRY